MRVLSASGGELEQGFGYGVVRQLFAAPLAAIGPKERARVMDGAAAAASAALSGLENAASASDWGSVLYGLYWLTANLAERQLLLVAVDDAHWADAASIMCLVHLARRVEGIPAPARLPLTVRPRGPDGGPSRSRAGPRRHRREVQMPSAVQEPGRHRVGIASSVIPCSSRKAWQALSSVRSTIASSTHASGIGRPNVQGCPTSASEAAAGVRLGVRKAPLANPPEAARNDRERVRQQ